MKRLNITIYGLVQGVSFRYHAREQANNLSITGFVKNLPNARVYIECQGDDENLERFVEWCQQGPDMAKVKKLDIVEAEPKDFLDFQIKS